MSSTRSQSHLCTATIYIYIPIYVYTYTHIHIYIDEDIAFYCDKTIAQSKQNIKETETDLKSVTAKEDYSDWRNHLNQWSESKTPLTSTQIQKFNNLKYKPETTREETLQPTKEPTADSSRELRSTKPKKTTTKTRKNTIHEQFKN